LSRMYFEAVKFRAHKQTVTSSIASATEPRRTRATLDAVSVERQLSRPVISDGRPGNPCDLTRRRKRRLGLAFQPMAEPTKDDVDAIVGPATPHFAYQLRARVLELVEELPENHEVRRYAAEKAELLDRLGYASSKAEEGPREPRSRPGWEQIPSAAPADEPLKPAP
jgi:hypothetical protein